MPFVGVSLSVTPPLVDVLMCLLDPGEGREAKCSNCFGTAKTHFMTTFFNL